MRWFKIISMSIVCIAALILFSVAAYQGNYWSAVGTAMIAIGSGSIAFEGTRE